MEKDVVLPIRSSVPVNDWVSMFPARHGRVSFEEFEGSAPLSGPMVRFIVSLHFEFGEFHKRIAQPLMADAGISALVEYASHLVDRMERAKPLVDANEGDYESVAHASMITELVQICFVESDAIIPGRFPRWLLRHCSAFFNIEEMVVEANQIIESEGALFKTDEPRFWAIVKQLALLDLSPVVAKLLRAYLDAHMQSRSPLRYSVELLASFYEEVPSLFEIAAAARSSEEAVASLEKRRQYASVALYKASKDLPTAVKFLWKLQVGKEDDYEDLMSEIMASSGDESLWFVQVMLAWTWLHPLDGPDPELLSFLAKRAVDEETSAAEASVVDAAVYAILSNDLVSLFTLVVEEQAPWFAPILADLCFYAGAIPMEIRDAFLLGYCHWLSASGSVPKTLGTRVAADIVLTLSGKATGRAGLEIFGRLGKTTKQWLSAVKLCPIDQLSWAESICMQKFHSDNSQGRMVDAIHSLSVAAEVAADVHIGACRISDFIDGNGDLVREALQRAQESSLGKAAHALLPEYIDSGRFDFYSSWTEKGMSRNDLVALVTSPNCPPEKVVSILSEIRANEGGEKLTTDQVVGLCKVLSGLDTWVPHDESAGTVNVLFNWLATQLPF